MTVYQAMVLEVDEKLRGLVNDIGVLPRGWVARTPSVHQIQRPTSPRPDPHGSGRLPS
ncbi:hypothetical protein [Sphaerisporangium rhizosphaerae]|uniref:Transposase n=1 Tax=Sphaerisporangium rhizosphaerae TaxID=2269375 RepID=A0ABW2PAU1_9ACTN